jgi:hypothetical protein
MGRSSPLRAQRPDTPGNGRRRVAREAGRGCGPIRAPAPPAILEGLRIIAVTVWQSVHPLSQVAAVHRDGPNSDRAVARSASPCFAGGIALTTLSRH